VVKEKNLGTKSRKNLKGLKRKIDIFIGTKNIFDPILNNQLSSVLRTLERKRKKVNAIW